ncbi:SprT-like domain-containing protein [Haloprofundus halobius]|uniref:SprT-like domain-containing protein n=1 Tax=Haloprofundus halobius TaxID=2876194 RepID=UPI001CC96C8F|nr:SprT-like domain-containing protein [Haloprofundus halobius]
MSSEPEEEVDTTYYAVGPEATVPEFLAVSKLYAREVVRHYGLTVDVSGLDWEVSKRAKRRAGAVKHRDGTPETVSLTWEFFQNCGWEATAETIRHELVHVHLLNEEGDGSHGARFEELAAELDTHVNCERFAEPKWWIRCASCGTALARYRRSKLVENTESYRCGSCGGSLRLSENRPRE